MARWWDRFRVFAGIGSWTNAAINAILHGQLIVATVSSIAMGIWGWFAKQDIYFVILGGLVTFTFVLFAMDKISHIVERRRLQKLDDSEIIKNSRDVQQGGAIDRSPERYFRDRDIYIYDFIADEQRVTNKTFERCAIFGPAVLWPFECNFVNVKTYGKADKVYLSAFTDYAPYGVIIVKGCTFVDCTFRRISLCYGELARETVLKLTAPTGTD